MYLEQIPQSLRKEGKDSIMGIKIGINGFGRIGRVVMRILTEDPEKFDICGINLRKADIDCIQRVKWLCICSHLRPA